MRTIEVQVNNSLSTERMIGSLSTVFGFLATLLAVIGPAGVMAYTVAQRTREVGRDDYGGPSRTLWQEKQPSRQTTTRILASD
jgi:hypothetical protein